MNDPETVFKTVFVRENNTTIKGQFPTDASVYQFILFVLDVENVTWSCKDVLGGWYWMYVEVGTGLFNHKVFVIIPSIADYGVKCSTLLLVSDFPFGYWLIYILWLNEFRIL